MDLSPSLKSVSSRSSSLVSLNRKLEPLLPTSIIPEKGAAKIRVRTLLGHCHYRRVFLWTLTLSCIAILTVFKAKNGGKAYDFGSYHFGGTEEKPQATAIPGTARYYYDGGSPIAYMTGDINGDGKEEVIPDDKLVLEQEIQIAAVQRQLTPWIRFPQFVTL